jgi:hypothetical protein
MTTRSIAWSRRLGGYIKFGRAVPRPSPAQGRPVAILPPPVAAKLALYDAMRTQRITRTALARRLGLQENAVRRLRDLDHRSHIDQIARALASLGKRLEVRVLEPAWIRYVSPQFLMNSLCVPPISEGPPRPESDLTCATERFLAPFSPRARCSGQTS